jgi:hypothetical protein
MAYHCCELFSQYSAFYVFWIKAPYSFHSQDQMMPISSLPTSDWERQLSKIKWPRTFKGLSLSLPSIIGSEWRFIMYVDLMHVQLAQETLKAGCWENHFTVIIGVGLTKQNNGTTRRIIARFLYIFVFILSSICYVNLHYSWRVPFRIPFFGESPMLILVSLN